MVIYRYPDQLHKVSSDTFIPLNRECPEQAVFSLQLAVDRSRENLQLSCGDTLARKSVLIHVLKLRSDQCSRGHRCVVAIELVWPHSPFLDRSVEAASSFQDLAKPDQTTNRTGL